MKPAYDAYMHVLSVTGVEALGFRGDFARCLRRACARGIYGLQLDAPGCFTCAMAFARAARACVHSLRLVQPTCACHTSTNSQLWWRQ